MRPPAPAYLLIAFLLVLAPGRAEATDLIDINTASSEELQRLPGIGPVRAEAIVRDREASGQFRSPEELQRVSGIGPATLAQVCHLIRAGTQRGCQGTEPRGADEEDESVERSPVNINLASESELMVLPRIGPTRASAIAEHRRAHGPFESVDDLERVPGIGPATVEGVRSWIVLRECLNATTIEHLRRVPGITPELAVEIIDEREAMGGFVAVESLLGLEGISPRDLEALRRWLEVREVTLGREDD